MMTEMIKKDLEALKGSLAYTLSLGDKELFHSNVLAWLLEQGQSTQAVTQLFVPKNAVIQNVLREEKLGERVQLDLLISYTVDGSEEEHFVVIENKFKSMPDKEQLNRYTEKCAEKNMDSSNTSFTLFAPRESIEIFERDLPQNWQTVTYNELVTALSEISFAENDPDADFKNGFVKSYKELLEKLLNIMELTVLNASKEESLYKPDERVINLLKEIRFHDVYEKLYVSTVFHTLDIEAKQNWKREKIYFHGGTLKWSYIPSDADVAYGIEIQRGKFIVFAETQDKSILKISDEDLTAKFESLLKLCFEEKSINRKTDGTLNQYYQGMYKYKYAKLTPKTTISELRNKIQTVMKAIQGK